MSQDRKASDKPAPRPAEANAKSGRKPYASPKVRSYGNIRDLTLGTGHTGDKDSAPGSHKTNT